MPNPSGGRPGSLQPMPADQAFGGAPVYDPAAEQGLGGPPGYGQGLTGSRGYGQGASRDRDAAPAVTARSPSRDTAACPPPVRCIRARGE